MHYEMIFFFCLFSKEGRGKSSADDSSRNACRRSSLAQHDNMVVQIFAMYPCCLLFFLATSSFFFIKFIILAGLFKRWTEVRTIAAPKTSLLELLLCFSSFSVAAINLDVATLFSLVFLEDIHTLVVESKELLSLLRFLNRLPSNRVLL